MYRKSLFLLLFSAGSLLRADLLINEVSFDAPPGTPDWVELYNPGPSPAPLQNISLSDADAASGKEILIDRPVSLSAGAYLTVYIDVDGEEDLDFSDGAGAVYSGTQTTVALAVTEDEVYLRRGDEILDFMAWVTDGRYDGMGDAAAAVAAELWPEGEAVVLSDAGAGYSLGRRVDGEDADGSSDFAVFSAPTPGATNAGAPPDETFPVTGRMVINEIAWGGTAASTSDEWLELLNDDVVPVSLAGWRLRTEDGDLDVGLQGVVPPGDYYLLERTADDTVRNIVADKTYSGSLGNEGESLLLVDASGRTVDRAPFSAGWPPGGGAPEFRSLERVSPAADGGQARNWRPHAGAGHGEDAAGGVLRGTPRARNSVYSLLLPTEEDCAAGCADGRTGSLGGRKVRVDRATNPFSPEDADPSRRVARIFFDAGGPDVVKTVRIADTRGETVRVLTDGDSGGLGGVAEGVLSWDGRDDGGRALPAGIYVVVFEGASPGGGRVGGKDIVVLGTRFR